MKKFLVFILLVFFFIPLVFTWADELENITRELESLRKDLNSKEANYQQLNLKLNNIKSRVYFIETEIKKKEIEVKKGEKVLEYQKNLLNERARSYYKNANKNSLNIISFFSGSNLSASLKDLFYQKTIVDQDKNTIIKVVLYIKNLEKIKKNLEEEKNKLTLLKSEIDNQSKILSQQINKTRSQIAQLSARQQQLIAQKLASLNIPRSAGSSAIYCTDDRNIDPGFSPAFAFFTFGIPHYVGMNQYGAYGRAKEGQDYKTILTTYYQNTSIECRDLPTEIKVEGYGLVPFEDYIKGVVNKEMGADIPEALKAQAVAARSYALVYTEYGKKEICASQKCQVYSGNRRETVNQAVDATGVSVCGNNRGEVLVSGGNVITAWYASTFGGYAHRCSNSLPNACNTSYTKEFLDAPSSVSSFDELRQKAYDRESKCFYAAQGWRSEYNNSAWLKPQELADIVNIILLVKNDQSVRDHLYQVDKPNPAGTDTWDFEKVRSELRSRGINPFSLINDAFVSADFSSGKTTSITFSGDGGSVSFSGSEFKDWFNLRAPANIQIVGPLYNIEKR